jgi:hypothetical protein
MPHITLPEGHPGIRSLFLFSPATYLAINHFVKTLLHEPAGYDRIGRQRAAGGYLTAPFPIKT